MGIGAWTKTAISLVSDAALVYGWFAKVACATGSTSVKVVSHIGTGASVVTFSWTATKTLETLSKSELNSFCAFLKEAAGYLPFIGTYNDFKASLKMAGYTVSFH